LATVLLLFVVSLFSLLGCSPGVASLVAVLLIAAFLAGLVSLGVGLIPSYVISLAGGFLLLYRHVSVTKDAAPVVTLVGIPGFGQVV
ncbi:malate/lactate/ureidoglycolate dehydrogenase, partial [Klebsiella pneumoniae]